MDKIKLYEVDSEYIEYLSLYSDHLFRNKTKDQKNERKYIGIVLSVNDVDYFAPLSSFKEKHIVMKEKLDFIKIKNYSVINLNNMFPVPIGIYHYVDINQEEDEKYRQLLLAEYRYIKSIQAKIRKNARILYNHKNKNVNSTALARRCHDFRLLEDACRDYSDMYLNENKDVYDKRKDFE